VPLADLGAIAIQNAFLYDRVFSSEEILRKSERLTTLGTLAAEIAHEIRNPLMVVRLLFDSLELSEEADAHQEKDLSIIREKLNHLDQIAGRILDFGKSREAFRLQCPMREIMTEAALLVRLKLEQSKVTLTMNELGADYLVFVDKGPNSAGSSQPNFECSWSDAKWRSSNLWKLPSKKISGCGYWSKILVLEFLRNLKIAFSILF
jgi:signal transduction histidine kinase